MIQLWSACLLGAMHWWKLAAKDNNMHTIPKLKTRRSNDKSKKHLETPFFLSDGNNCKRCKFIGVERQPRQCTWLISSWIGLRTGRAWNSERSLWTSLYHCTCIRYRFPRLFLLLFLQLGWTCYMYRPVRLLTFDWILSWWNMILSGKRFFQEQSSTICNLSNHY